MAIYSKRINLRDEGGLSPLPLETPRIYRYSNTINRVLTGSLVPVPEVASPWIIYLDLSKWNWPIDLQVAYERGVRAVWIKQGQGEWPDSAFDDLVAAAVDAGMKFGFYHFCDPTQTSVTPERAAALAYSMIQGKGDFSIWLDVERSGNLTAAGLLDYLIRWCDAFRNLSNRKIEIYSRPSFFNSAVARSSYWLNNAIDLNAARYNISLASPWSDGLYVPLDWNYSGTAFNKWQYDDSNGLGEYYGAGDGAALSVDLSIFPGTFEDLIADQLGGSVDPPEIGINSNTKFVVRSDTLNCRNYPTTATTFDGQPVAVLAKAKKGDIVYLVSEVESVYAPAVYNEVWARCLLPDGATVGWMAVVHGGYPYLKSID